MPQELTYAEVLDVLADINGHHVEVIVGPVPGESERGPTSPVAQLVGELGTVEIHSLHDEDDDVAAGVAFFPLSTAGRDGTGLVLSALDFHGAFRSTTTRRDGADTEVVALLVGGPTRIQVQIAWNPVRP